MKSPLAAWRSGVRWPMVLISVLVAVVALVLVCGKSLGVRDPDAIENTLVTEREPVASFARFLD